MSTEDHGATGRHRTRRGFLAAGVGTAASIYLAACGGSGSSSKSSSAATSASGGGGGGGKVTLNNLFQQQAGYSASDLAGMTKAFEKANPNITVNNTLVAYEALHDKIVAAAPAGTYDVVLGDGVWPAEFGTRKLVLDVTDRMKQLPLNKIFPGALSMCEYKGTYYGAPWILDTKYLFANQQMLRKAGISPSQLKTWTGVLGAMKTLKDKKLVKYPWLGSWAQAEAVVADYTQYVGAFGGSFTDSSGKPTLTSPGGIRALEFMRALITQGLADPASTSALEEDCLKAFAQGKIAMNLNWTFQLAAANDPKQSRLPKGATLLMHTPQGVPGQASHGVNGGQPVMITSGSKHPDESWEYIKFITGQSEQDDYVKDSLPIWAASYTNPTVVKDAGSELVSVAKTQLPNMILRPQVPDYNAVSQALQVQLQNALLGKKSPADALKAASSTLSSSAPPS